MVIGMLSALGRLSASAAQRLRDRLLQRQRAPGRPHRCEDRFIEPGADGGSDPVIKELAAK